MEVPKNDAIKLFKDIPKEFPNEVWKQKYIK